MKKLLIIVLILMVNIPIAYGQFGKNKVQYNTYDWKYIQSQHFNVYYDKGSKYLAEFTAIEAEEALEYIQDQLNYDISNRGSIIVYESHNDFQQTNVISVFMPEGVGGVTELYKNRVVVPFQGDYAQLRHVIHHELIHFVLNELFYGGTFQTAVSTGNTFMIPIWINEGLAEFSSLYGMNAETDMFMRDLTISENLPPLKRLNGYLSYRGGQTFFWYIARTYGKEKVGEFMNRLKIHRNLDDAFNSTFGMDFKDFSEKWEREIKKIYWPDLETYDNPDEYAIAITDHDETRNFYNSSPAISPDGQKMAYIADESGIFGIFVKELDKKSERRQLVSSFRQKDFEDLNMTTPGISWSPTGDKIAISAKAGGRDAVFIVDVETEDYKKYTWDIKSISSVEWSPDGKYIAFIGTKELQSDIYIYAISEDNLINLTNDIFSDFVPVWSPDSKEIYFISDRGNYTKPMTQNKIKMWKHNFDHTDIFNIKIENKETTRLTFDPENKKTSVAVAPDNNRLIYTSDKNGIYNVYELNQETKRIRPLTNSISGVTQLSLARDGSKLLFTAQVEGAYDIFMLRFPFEKDLEMDELPITTFKEEQLQRWRDVQEIAEVSSDSTDSAAAELTGYGNFNIDFSRQKVVQPNPDIQRDKDNNRPKNQEEEEEQFIERDYKVTFSPDLISGNPGVSTFYGFQGVTQFVFSDVLGDHQLYLQANLLIDLLNSSFYLGYNYLPGLVDYHFAGYHTSARVILSDRYLYRLRNYGASVFTSYPFDLFNRVQGGLNWMNLAKENMDDPTLPSVERMIVVPEVSYIHDDALWGYFGPQKGMRYNVTLKGSPKFNDDAVGFFTLTGDFRYYINILDYMSIALRGAAGGSFGPDPQNFFMGGTSNWINRSFYNGYLPFDDPADFAFMEFQMPMRGWRVAERTGNKFFITNLEYRFPLFQALLAGPIPILFQGVMGSVFLDVGGAWSDEFELSTKDENGNEIPKDLLMSAGLGIRTYFLGLPWKIDIAWRNEFSGWSRPYYMFSLGYDF